MSTTRPTLTTTSYAILGLLSVRSWTTHELVQQVDRSLRRIWPRAQSKLYEEPKKLVAHGYATASDDSIGRRRRTRYTITRAGRRALASWLSEPGAGPVLESEQLLKIHFADSGSTADVLTNLHAVLAWVLDQNAENVAAARAYAEERGPFPERAALNQLTGRFLTDYYEMIATWAEWAIDVVERWPDDVAAAPYDMEEAVRALRRAERVTARLQRRGSAPPPASRGTRP